MESKKQYIIIGPPNLESDDNLYWSNEDGWGCLDTATRFSMEIFHVDLPIETQAIAEIFEDNTLGQIFEVVGSPSGRVVHLKDFSSDVHFPS